MSTLSIVPIRRAEAQRFVAEHHRHLGPVTGAIFQVACADGDRVCGVAICGRPVNRTLDDGWTLEANRCCTDGTKNANSMLYAACWRVARSLGYKKLITYTKPTESGASLRAAGWKVVHQTRGDSWNRKKRPRVDVDPWQPKLRWEVA